MSKVVNDARAYLSEGKAVFDSSIGGTAYRSMVRDLKRMAKDIGVVIDLRTEDLGAEMELNWKIVESIPCVGCARRIQIGDQLTEVRILKGIPENYEKIKGLEVQTELLGYKHAECGED